MIGFSQYTALILAASLAAIPIVGADSIAHLDHAGGVTPKASDATIIPLTTAIHNKVTAATQTIVGRRDAVASMGEKVARAAGSRGGFSAPVKKKRKSPKKTREPRTETSNFNSTIVDSWLMVLSVGTPPQELE